MWGTNLLRQGAQWQLGNEKSISFELDVWLANIALLTKACHQQEEDMLQWSVVDFWELGRGWKWERFAHLLPPSNLVMLAEKSINPEVTMPDQSDG